jgi:hypothetical protein
MSFSLFVSFQSRFVTYLLMFFRMEVRHNMKIIISLQRLPRLNNVQNTEIIPMLQSDMLTNCSNKSYINRLYLTL